MNARSHIPDWQNTENLKRLTELRSSGFRIEYSATQYQVWHNGKYLGGASTFSGKCHGRYREANLREFLNSALLIANRAILTP